ncbi:MAG: single-stranded DNA-binding protein [Candidatus Coprovivens sp.]
MLNQVVLVGRLTKDPELSKLDNDKKVTVVTLAVQRSWKNESGIYEADFIRCYLWDAIAANTTEYCHKGDIVGIKGRIQTGNYDDKDGNKKYTVDVIAEKVTFLSSKPKEEE